jgi:hypothetical protein
MMVFMTMAVTPVMVEVAFTTIDGECQTNHKY